MDTTSNSTTLSTADIGQGPALVFVHGFPLSRGAWQKQIEAFGAAYRVMAPDLRGFGQSGMLPGTATMAHYAADVHALLRQRSTGPVVLVGHSMGGYVALSFARQFPDMLRGLVLVGSKAGADTPEAAAGRRATAAKVESEGQQGVEGVIAAMAPKMLVPGSEDAGMLDDVRGLMASATPAGVIGALLGMAERPDSTALLAQIIVPTLVITGADDALVPPSESERMAQAVRGAQLTVIPHAGHLVAFEQPEAFNRALQEWLDSTGLARLPG